VCVCVCVCVCVASFADNEDAVKIALALKTMRFAYFLHYHSNIFNNLYKLIFLAWFQMEPLVLYVCSVNATDVVLFV